MSMAFLRVSVDPCFLCDFLCSFNADEKKKKCRRATALDNQVPRHNHVHRWFSILLRHSLQNAFLSIQCRCAKALGYEVIEVNPSQLRSGAAIRRLFGEATQSHHVSSAETNTKPGMQCMRTHNDRYPSGVSRQSCNCTSNIFPTSSALFCHSRIPIKPACNCMRKHH